MTARDLAQLRQHAASFLTIFMTSGTSDEQLLRESVTLAEAVLRAIPDEPAASPASGADVTNQGETPMS